MSSRRVASLFRHVAPRSGAAQSEAPVAAIRRSTRWLSSPRRTNYSLEDTFESACSTHEIPGVALLATNRTCKHKSADKPGSWLHIALQAAGTIVKHSVADPPMSLFAMSYLTKTVRCGLLRALSS